MSRTIDYSDPNAWTEEEIAYLRQRSWLIGRNGLPADTLDQLETMGLVTATPEEGEEDSASYSDMTNEQLRIELASRNLSVQGRKDDLIARLEADDVTPDNHEPIVESDEDDEDDDEDEED